MTKNNLGNAYLTLAGVEDKAENCRRAVKAYEEALEILTEEEFPEPHRLVERNFELALSFCRES